MPRLNAHGAAVMGVGGPVTIDNVTYAQRGTNACWLNDDTIIAQCADDQWRVSICKVGQPGQWAAYSANGCNELTAGGGLWQAHLVGVDCFGEYGSLGGYSLGLTDNDGRGYAGPGGEINIIPAGGVGLEIHSRSGVTPIPFGPARDVQVLGPASAIWRDDGGLFYTQGVPCPAQASGGSNPRYCVLPNGEAWIVYFAGAYGLIAHPADDASTGVVLAGPGQPAFYPDARVVNGSLVACWSTGAGEYPGELVVVRDVLSLPRVEFGSTPEPPNPEPPNPEPGPEPGPEPEPPMLVYDFSPCQQYSDSRWPELPHHTGEEQSAAMATILFELRAMGHPFEMFLKSSGQHWVGWDGQSYSEDVCVVVQDGAKWWKDIIVMCGDPAAYISFGNAHDYLPPSPGDEDKCVPPPTPPDAPEPQPPEPEPPAYVGPGYLRTAFGNYLRAKKKSGELEQGEAQLLTLTDEGEGRVSIRIGGSGKYVCADPNVPDDPLMANRDSVGPWERFYVTHRGDGTITLTAEGSGYEVCAEKSGKVTARGPVSFIFEPD